MINKLAISIVKKNFHIFGVSKSVNSFKIIHLFSDKKNPFKKFQRGSQSQKKKQSTTNNKQNKQQPIEQQDQKIQQQQNVDKLKVNQQQNKPAPSSSQNKTNPASGFNNFKIFSQNSTPLKTSTNDKQIKQQPIKKQAQKKQKEHHTDNLKANMQQEKPSSISASDQPKPAAGFNKFKRYNQFAEKVNIKPKSIQTLSNKPQQKKKQQPQKVILKVVQKIKQTTSTTKTQEQNLKIKGFNKFKRVQITKSTTKQAQSSNKQHKKQIKQKQVQSSINKTQQQEKVQQSKQKNILNNKTTQQESQYIDRQKAQKITQQKKKQGNEKWQKLFHDQVKQKKKEKIQQKNNVWGDFGFSNSKGKNKQHQPNQPIPPKTTPATLMKRLLFLGILVYFSNEITSFFLYDSSRTVEITELMDYLKTGQIRQSWFLTSNQSLSEEFNRTKKYCCATLGSGSIVKVQSNSQFQIQWSKLIDKHNQQSLLFNSSPAIIKRPPIIKKNNHVFNLIHSLLSFGLVLMFIQSLMGTVKKGKGMGGSGFFDNAKSHRFKQNINVKFNDVVGMNRAKEEIVEFIDFLKNADKYNRLGAKIPRGALLTGPPGTGKTMLAKACAGESEVPFFTISGSQFMEMYVGVGAQRVRALFAEARAAAPAIIFIDEIDAVGKKRSSGAGGGGNDQRDNTLNQLLVEMDGFDQTTNVIIFAATNQRQVLDPALTRPGRFDRLIEVDLPDIQGRKQIFMVHLKPITLDEKYSVQDYAKRLATLTPGFSGAQIKNLCNEAAIIAARGEKTFVSMVDFQSASERVIGGVQKKSTLITPQTKRTVAYHQCGHGVVSWFMQHASPLLKLTIIPRSKGALGYAQYLPNENNIYTRKQLQDQICVILGGRISEEIFFGKISTGASDDLQKAHKVAKAIVTQYGMGKSLGWLSYGETQYAKQYSHQTQEKIDVQIIKIIADCSIRTRQILNGKRDILKSLAETLLQQETIDQKTIQSILGERPFKSSKQYEQYIRQRQKMIDDNTVDKPQPPAPALPFKSLISQLKLNSRVNMIDNN